MQSFVLAAALLLPLSRPGMDTFTLYPRPSEAPIASMSPRQLRARVTEMASLPLTRRLAFWSAAFVGTPYGSAPLADESSPELSAPVAGQDLSLYRVDCETYVEQVLALALASKWDQVVPILRKLRYIGGRPDPSRRQFTVVNGWLASAQRQGLLQDITRKVGQMATRVLRQRLKPSKLWRPYYLRRMRLMGPLAPVGTAEITYIPLARAALIARRIPPGAVVHVVSSSHPRSPYLVIHMGFAMRHHARPVFRHASQSPRRRKVEDRPFSAYMRYIGRTPSGPEMRVGIGIHLSAVAR